MGQYIKSFLKIMEFIFKKAETKKDIIDLIYKIRYFEQIPVSKHASIKDIKSITKQIENIEKAIITKACNLKALNIISLNVSENYKITMEIINTGIIDLESINIELKKQSGNILLEVFEDKSLEKELTYSKIPELNIKPNKMIKLFI